MSAQTVRLRQVVVDATWWRWLVVAATFFALAFVLPSVLSKVQSVSETRELNSRDRRTPMKGVHNHLRQAHSQQNCAGKTGHALKKCLLELRKARAVRIAASRTSHEVSVKGHDVSKSPVVVWLTTCASFGSGVATCVTALFTYNRERRDKENYLREMEKNFREEETHRWQRERHQREVEKHQFEREIHKLTRRKLELELDNLEREGQASEAAAQNRRTQRAANTKFRVV